MTKIGIDFGTSFCSASWINPVTKRPEAVTFHETGTQKMPSVVYYQPDGNVLVGKTAYNYLEDAGLGKFSDEKRIELLSSIITNIKLRLKPNGVTTIHDPNNIKGRKIAHQTVVKDIFLKIKTEVEETCFDGEAVTDVTVTHPVNFDEWKKDTLKKAAMQAGFERVELYEEPVSAAMGYLESTEKRPSGILVYDFGGGTFDAAYVTKGLDGTYRVPFPAEGDSACGGNDIDRLLYEEWDKLALREKGRSIGTDNKLDRGILSRCRSNKETISEVQQYTFNEMLPPPGFHRISMTLERKRFNEIISPVIDKTIRITQNLLNKIKDGNYPLETVIMIGGSSRIPLISERLSGILPAGVKLQKVLSVDVAVAKGALCEKCLPTLPAAVAEQCHCGYCGKTIKRMAKHCGFCGKPNFMYGK